MTRDKKAKRNLFNRALLLLAGMAILTVVSTRLRADTGSCGGGSITLPFTDVPSSNIFFCSIAAAYFTGLTNGSTATSYNPAGAVNREQMAAFVSRTLDQSLKRSSSRTELRQFWTTQGANALALTTVGDNPAFVESDGVDLWVTNTDDSTISRVRASDGKLLGTWTNAGVATGVLCAMGKVFVTGTSQSGNLSMIDPTQPPGPVTTVSSQLGGGPSGIAFDGQRIWTANLSGSVSIITLNPLTVTTVTSGFGAPTGILYDGANIWVTDVADNRLKKLDANGTVLQSVQVGSLPRYPAFDGTNIWVPNSGSNTISVVRATGGLSGTVIATLSGNGLNQSFQAAFDGERILVPNRNGSSVSLWKATDLTPIGSFSIGAGNCPGGACSDGLNFWITLPCRNKLARF